MPISETTARSETIRIKVTGFPLACLLAAIPLMAVFFYGVVGEDKFLLLSPLTMTGYAVLFIWMLRAALTKQAAFTAPPAFYPFLAFLAYGIILSTTCPIAYEAKVRMLFLGLFAGAYFLWGNTLSLFRNNRVILGCVLVFALLACCYGLIDYFKTPDRVLWAQRYYVYEGRLASTYICPNHFAHLLQMLLPFCFVLLFIPQAGIFLRLLAGYCILAFLPTLYFTESRAGMLGSILALGVTACLLALRKSKKLFVVLLVLVPLVSVILLAGAWKYSSMFKRRMTPVVEFLSEFHDQGFANTQTTDFRPLTWMDSWDMVKEKPASGFGPGSYRYIFPKYRHRFKGARVVTGHPHNEYLEIASEYGLVGLGLFALAWCYGLIRLLVFAIKTPNQHHAFMAMAFIGTAAGTMLHSFFDYEMHVFQNALIFCLLAGMAAGPLCARQKELLEVAQPARLKWHRMVRFALAVLVAIGFLVSLQTFSSAFLRSTADRLAAAGKEKKAKQYYHAAIRIDSANWRAYKGLGIQLHKDRYYSLDLVEKKKLAKIEGAVQQKGYEHNPMGAELAMDLGQTRFFLGDIEGGLALMKHAAQMRPFNDEAWWQLGVAQRKAGRYAEALKTFKYAASVKNSPSTRANIKWIEKQMSEGKKQKIEVGGQKINKPAIGNRQSTMIQSAPHLNLNPTNATVDPGLMKLLDKMDH